MHEFDIDLPGDRRLHGQDTGSTGRAEELVVFWHAGSPNIGASPAPLFVVSGALGVRWLGADPPGHALVVGGFRAGCSRCRVRRSMDLVTGGPLVFFGLRLATD